MTSVRAVAGLIIQTLVDYADLAETERRRALEAASPRSVVHTPGRNKGLAFGATWMGTGVQADLKRQVPPAAELPRTAMATLEVAHQLLNTIQKKDDLMPILVFDDTDRWFRDLGSTASHQDLSLAFFGRVLPELRQLPAGLVVAVHDNYLKREDLAGHLRDTIEARIDIPLLDSSQSLGKVIQSRVIAHTSIDSPSGAPPLSEIIESSALDRLYDLYRDRFVGSLRDVLRIVHVATTDACDARFETVTPSLVDQAW